MYPYLRFAMSMGCMRSYLAGGARWPPLLLPYATHRTSSPHMYSQSWYVQDTVVLAHLGHVLYRAACHIVSTALCCIAADPHIETFSISRYIQQYGQLASVITVHHTQSTLLFSAQCSTTTMCGHLVKTEGDGQVAKTTQKSKKYLLISCASTTEWCSKKWPDTT